VANPYLHCLKGCQVCLLILDWKYGNPPHLSATHQEYRFARDNKMPILVFLKGTQDNRRETKILEFLEEIKKDQNTYRRFHDRLDLESPVKLALKSVLTNSFGYEFQEETSENFQDEQASSFEQQALNVSSDELDKKVAANWLNSIGEQNINSSQKLLHTLRSKGLIRLENSEYQIQVSGLLFLGKNPAKYFPQCRIFLDAFKGTIQDSTPMDQMTLSAPAPTMLNTAWEFIQRNTRHPMRVSGLIRVILDEYPEEAVREAIVNAIAHRNYEDRSRQIIIKLFADRLEIISPGAPLKPLTLAKIRMGNCLPHSRNPILGQYLNHMKLMDQRGSGLGRMKKFMLNHGLQPPVYDLKDGYFRVTLIGPGEDLNQLKIPKNTPAVVSASVEATMNERQKKILNHVYQNGDVTSGWCKKTFGVTYNTAYRDLSSLVEMQLLIQTGKGRSTRYIVRESK